MRLKKKNVGIAIKSCLFIYRLSVSSFLLILWLGKQHLWKVPSWEKWSTILLELQLRILRGMLVKLRHQIYSRLLHFICHRRDKSLFPQVMCIFNLRELLPGCVSFHNIQSIVCWVIKAQCWYLESWYGRIVRPLILIQEVN